MNGQEAAPTSVAYDVVAVVSAEETLWSLGEQVRKLPIALVIFSPGISEVAGHSTCYNFLPVPGETTGEFFDELFWFLMRD